MSLDTRLNSIVDDFSERVLTAFRDTLVGAVASVPLAALRDVAKRAYELGYREALAAQGSTPGPHVPSSGGASNAQNATATGDLQANDVDDMEDVDTSDPADVADVDGEIDGEPNRGAASVDWSAFDGARGSDSRRDSETGSTADTLGGPAPRSATSLRIFPHATVSTLRNRIIDVFGLDRFDLDVVVCRKGDRTRRQLKGSVKLSKYMAER